MPGDHRLGFQSTAATSTGERLPVKGSLPPWLQGTLLRNGPALWETDGLELAHWFDGMAMLHSFTIRRGEVTYTSRPLESKAYRHANQEGELAFGEFATDPCRNVFQRVFTLFSEAATDNANVNISRMADRFVALTETPIPVAFDPETLTTQGQLAYTDALDGQHTTAHPHHDPDEGTTWNYHTRFSRKSTYVVTRMPDGTTKRAPVAEIPVERPSYMHSFGLTARYVILTEFPLLVDPKRFVLEDKPFIEHYRWQPGQGTRIHVIDRETGERVCEATTEPCFAFHHVNAHETEDGHVVCDIATFPDASLIDALYLDNLRAEDPTIPDGQLVRLTVDPASGLVTRSVLLDETFELPRIAYSRCNTKPYRYAYGIGSTEQGTLWDKLTKDDVEEGETWTWSQPDCYPGEPVFVPAPEADGEDEGVILSVVLDSQAQASFLLVLDASTFEELARAHAPRAIPFGFHGQFHAAG